MPVPVSVVVLSLLMACRTSVRPRRIARCCQQGSELASESTNLDEHPVVHHAESGPGDALADIHHPLQLGSTRVREDPEPVLGSVMAYLTFGVIDAHPDCASWREGQITREPL